MFSQISSTYIIPMVLNLGDASWLGMMEAISGGAMLLGGIIASLYPIKKGRYIHTIFVLQLLCALFQILLGFQKDLIFLVLIRGLYCLIVPIINTCALTFWQSKTPNYLQGRVYSARQLIVRALTPIAYIIAGPFVDNFAPWILNKFKILDKFSIISNYHFVIVLTGCMLFICLLLFYSNKSLKDADNINL